MQISKVCKFRTQSYPKFSQVTLPNGFAQAADKNGSSSYEPCLLGKFPASNSNLCLELWWVSSLCFCFGDFTLAPCETYNDKSINLISEAYLIHLLWLGCLVVLVLNRIITTNERLRKNSNDEKLPPSR